MTRFEPRVGKLDTHSLGWLGQAGQQGFKGVIGITKQRMYVGETQLIALSETLLHQRFSDLESEKVPVWAGLGHVTDEIALGRADVDM